MVTLKLLDKTFNMPENWDEVNLSLYKKINSFLTVNEDLTEGKKMISLLSIMTNISETDLENIEYKSLQEIIGVLTFITEEKIIKKISNTLVIGDDTYTLKAFNKLTLGEIISLEQLILDGDVFQNVGGMIYILYSKNGEAFDSDLLESEGLRIEDNISINQVMETILFFCLIVNKHSEITKKSLAKKKWKMMTIKQKLTSLKNSIKDGIGSASSRGWQMGISLASKKLPHKTI